MISNNIHVKVVEALRSRKLKVEKSYDRAGVLGFWLPIIFLALQVIYHVCRIIVADMGAVAMLFSDVIVKSRLLKFIESFNLPLLIACIVFAVLGYVAFGLRSRPSKYLYMALCVVFTAVSVLMIVIDYWVYTYAVAIFFCVMMFFVCIDCIKAQNDDRILAKSEGYPHFNSIFMQDEKKEKSEIRFADKKSYDELYDERLEKYAEENPDTQMARIFVKEKAEKLDTEIGDWLGGMMGKNEEDE